MCIRDREYTTTSYMSCSMCVTLFSVAGLASASGNVSSTLPALELSADSELPVASYIELPKTPPPRIARNSAGTASSGVEDMRLDAAHGTLEASRTLDPVRLGNPVNIDDSGLNEDADERTDDRLQGMGINYPRKSAPRSLGGTRRRIGTPYGI